MAGIIHKIITLYEMEASEISSLVTNSQKVFKNFVPEDDTFEKKLDKEIKRMEAFVKERLKPFDNAQGRSV